MNENVDRWLERKLAYYRSQLSDRIIARDGYDWRCNHCRKQATECLFGEGPLCPYRQPSSGSQSTGSGGNRPNTRMTFKPSG
jgi:hypothetical protein